MKKNKFFILGMLVLALALTFGLVLVGCENDSDSGSNNGGNNSGSNNSGGNNSGGNNSGGNDNSGNNSGGNNSGGNNSGGNNSGGGTESITLNSNGQWGWQAVYESDSLFSGNKITQGDTYTITYSFTSDVPMDYLQVVLIDNGAQGSSYRWVELSGYIKVKENIAANTVYSGTTTITATGTATDATALANRLVLQAGMGTANQPTLTFTTLSLANGNSGGNNNGGNNNGGNNNGGGTTVPSAPTGVTATAQSSSSISVSWNSVSGATGYYIYRSSTSSGTYSQVGTSSSTSYTNTGLSASTTYYYKVAAYNSSGTSSQSSYDYATTQTAAVARETRLAQPTFGTCSISGSNAIFNWTLQTTGTTPTGLYDYVAPTSIKIEVYIDTSSSWHTLETLSGTARSYTLSNWTAWSYIVGGASQRVSLRVTCIRSGNTDTSAIMSYWKSTSGSTSTWVPTY